MKSMKQCYSELLSLTQLFLLREYSLKDFTTVDPAALAFFQNKMRNLKLAPSPKQSQNIVENQQTQNLKVQTQEKIIPSLQPPKLMPSQPPQPLQSQPLRPQFAQPQASISLPLQPQNVQSRSETTPLNLTSAPTAFEPSIPSPPAAIPAGSKKSKQFSLEPWSSIPPQNIEEFWKICPALFPEWRLCEAIPSDAIAQKQKNIWLKNQEILPVLILSFYDNEQQLTFLKNIAHAISLRLAPAKVISAIQFEKENSWANVLNSPHLRLIIANDYGLYLQPKLMHFYKEVPQQNKHFLNQIPVLLLSDLSLYLKEPQLKPLLWRAICNEFAALR